MFGRPGLAARLKQVEDRLEEISEMVERVREIELAWNDTLDRMNAIMHRVNTRANRAAEATAPPQQPQINPAAERILRLGFGGGGS